MLRNSGTRRGLGAPRMAVAAGVTVMLVLALPSVAWAAKGGGIHKSGSGQPSGGGTTTSSTTTTTAPTTTTTSTTTTTTAPPPPPADTTPPAVSISAPGTGSTVSGTVSVDGSSSDNVSVASVRVSVDGAPFQTATGTTSWSWWWPTSGLANGSHTVSAQAVDSSGNVSSTASVTVNVSNGSTSAPNSQGTWTSPEGVTISVNSTGTDPDNGGTWTISDVYSLLQADALDLSSIGPTLTINLQDSNPSVTATGCGSTFTGTMSLNGYSGTFATRPDAQFTHEYGEIWTQYYLCVHQQESWSAYLNERWVNSSGSDTLATDPNTNTSFQWQPAEIIADDYRMLFGSSLAVSQMGFINPNMLDPRNQPGLGTWLLDNWR